MKSSVKPPGRKIVGSIAAALDACELRDGQTISFHHHYRNGDMVLNLVLEAIAARGLKDMKIAASSIFPVHAPLVGHIERETVTGVSAGFISGPVGEAIARGLLREPAQLLTHGGRAFAIESGALAIDVAFIAAPCCDEAGNMNGVQGRSPCGVLGYARVDSQYARRVVALTDSLAPYPVNPIEIPQDRVDVIVELPQIGDPGGIVSGATRPSSEPAGIRIAELAAQCISASGLLRDGFSFQTGAGGISLRTAAKVRDAMMAGGVVGSFASGGITGAHVEMLEKGLFRSLFDVQCFDLEAVASLARNARHTGMSASTYASPGVRGAVVDHLDAVVLGAAEVDRDFNVNVVCDRSGLIIGGSGGHADTAAGAKLCLITTRLTAGGSPKIVERVRAVTTPGRTVDAVVSEIGVAVNPARQDLIDRFAAAGVPLVNIEALVAQAGERAGVQAPPVEGGPVVARVFYRDGVQIDQIARVDAGKLSAATGIVQSSNPSHAFLGG